jgi:hypothetical protein
LGLTFFGLRPEDKEIVVLEPTFLLMYYGGFMYTEAYNLPVSYRRWFIERIGKELNKKGSNGNPQPTRALHQDTPETRALLGRTRDHAPSRLRRFS